MEGDAQPKNGEGSVNNGTVVQQFEEAFAEYVGARFGIALNSGTSTLHTALVAMGVRPGDKVAVPPLTMASTTLAVLHAGAVPGFADVDPDTWLINPFSVCDRLPVFGTPYGIPVSLYGLHGKWNSPHIVDEAAQTLRPHGGEYGGAGFTSYSFQASKILPLGEGGMLVTDSEALATKARSFSSLGYNMDPKQPRIDPATLKHPDFARHHSLGWNYRMSDAVAEIGLAFPMIDGWPMTFTQGVDIIKEQRRLCAHRYREAIQGCDWLTPQHVPDGWQHDYWTFAVATDTPERCLWLLDAMERHGGERPYPAWRISYFEPFMANHPRYTWEHQRCPVAESLQPRLVQFQTNHLASAEQNAKALRKAIEEAG